LTDTEDTGDDLGEGLPLANDTASPGGAMVAIESARETAAIQAEYLMAQRFPRDVDKAMRNIERECASLSLAEVATYSYVKGGTTVSDAGIRLAEVIAQQWGNMKVGVRELSRENGYSHCIAFALDTEARFSDEKTFQVRHWRDTRRGGYAITSEREIYELVANQGARRKRACILTVVPRWAKEQAVQWVEETLMKSVDNSQQGVDQMLRLLEPWDITAAHIEKRIGRAIDSITPMQMVLMRKVANSLRDGMSNPDDWFDVPPPEGSKPKGKTLADIAGAEARTETPEQVTGADSLANLIDNAPNDNVLAGLKKMVSKLNDPQERGRLYSLIKSRSKLIQPPARKGTT